MDELVKLLKTYFAMLDGDPAYDDLKDLDLEDAFMEVEDEIRGIVFADEVERING